MDGKYILNITVVRLKHFMLAEPFGIITSLTGLIPLGLLLFLPIFSP